MSDHHRRYFDRLTATVVLRQVIVLAEQSLATGRLMEVRPAIARVQ